jgi:DNA polymerase
VKRAAHDLAEWVRYAGELGLDGLMLPAGIVVAPRDAGPARAPEVTGLAAVREQLGDCRRCRLAERRRSIVFGQGNPEAELVFVGEAPGQEEDRQGLPFVGPAGQLLTRMIEAMGRRREDVYICNIIKCRPPSNRDPEDDEIAACSSFLLRQIDAIGPKVIVTLGKFAAQTMLDTTEPISRLRGRLHDFKGVPLMPTFHPAYLLRSPHKKREAWEDLQQVMALLEAGG